MSIQYTRSDRSLARARCEASGSGWAVYTYHQAKRDVMYWATWDELVTDLENCELVHAHVLGLWRYEGASRSRVVVRPSAPR